MAAVLERTTFEISRASEYFTARELQSMTGQPEANFAAVVLKELADNALDACEAARITPVLELSVEESEQAYVIRVADNGLGIPPEIVRRILNFETRTTDKAHYRAPTRGAQGNALKTVLGIPHALGSVEPVVIEARGIRHVVRAWVDPAGELHIDHREEPSKRTEGTRVTVTVPSRGQQFDPPPVGAELRTLQPARADKIPTFRRERFAS